MMGYMNGLLLIIFAQSWHFEPVSGASDYIAIDVDSSGMPAVVYWKDSTIYYARRAIIGDSAVWPAESVYATPLSAYIFGREFAVGRNSIPHMLFHNWRTFPNFLDVYYATKDSMGQWQSFLIDSFAVMGDVDTDTSDYPHIVYTTAGVVYYRYWDGSNWIGEFIDSSYSLMSLKVDRQNRPHIGLGAPITYKENRLGYAGYCWKDSTGWHLEYMTQYDVRDPIGIDVDETGNPHLAFSVYYGSSYHLVKSNNEWSVDDISSYGYYGSLLGIYGSIVHLLGFSSDWSMARHLWKEDTVWMTEDIYPGYSRDLAIDEDGYLHCLFVSNDTIIYGTNRPQVFITEDSARIAAGRIPGIICKFPAEFFPPVKGQVYDLKIIDVKGGFVRTLNYKHDARLLWDGRDKNGRLVGAGVYFIIINSNCGRQMQKITVIR